MKTQCPHCKAVLTIPDHYALKPIKCSNCGDRFKAILFSRIAPAPPPLAKARSVDTPSPSPIGKPVCTTYYILAGLSLALGSLIASFYMFLGLGDPWATFYIALLAIPILFTAFLVALLFFSAATLFQLLRLILARLDTIAKTSEKK